MRTAEILAHGRENNFNLIRISAAFAVIVSHSYPLALGQGAVEPLENILPFSLGALGVRIFFVISGFLILKSFMQRRSTAAFTMARARRILPGLAVVSIVVAFVIGPLMTTLPVAAYLSHPTTLAYAPRAVSLVWLTWFLPGVFLSNPYPDAVNGPLWTLPAEVECYAGLAIAGLIGFYRPRLFPLMLLAYVPVYIVTRYGLLPGHDFANLAALSFAFVLGMAAYFYRGRLPIDFRLLLALIAAAAVAIWSGFLADELATVAIGYGALWLGAADFSLLRTYNRIGDYSYGVYVYGWPMQQVFAALWPGISPWQMMAAAGLAALGCAILSWHIVEKPALTWRRGPRSSPASEADRVEDDKSLQASRDGAYW
ncbi:MAG: acyltransferase family protein [Allosphingosinicella sp.]